jgi:hypothetical protein
MENSERSIEHILGKFKGSLDRHGYGFQYRVLKAANDLFRENTSFFAFEVAEFPVEVQSSDTKVDFILRRTVGPFIRRDGTASTSRRRPLFLVAECKRANPALSDWCFLRAPFTRSGGFLNALVLDSIQPGNGQFHATSRTIPFGEGRLLSNRDRCKV